ncbi:thioredoxin-like protein [Fimicolochytrium jonesii]|uniref:thioredoxin-like protein n=1 Tax=Fimicolochytrium jonesii TaxID=1396493 RepID=UPI0022FEB3CC|nr:thioredoxin-like protein [Fimicolochytrium jonesii]KAI8816016.1 thioredoxin-like protein [Fimicolochytrium jonesii]
MTRSWKALSAFVLVCALLGLVSASESSHVLDLTADNFDKHIDGSKPALVEFFAPWCGHCKSLAPTYEELGAAYAHAKGDVIIAKVDADKHKDLGQRFGVSGFPTLKWFPKGKKDAPEDYNAGRELKDFIGFIDGKAGVRARVKKVETAVTVLTSSNFDEIVKNKKNNVLVEFYAPWCGHCKNLAPIYEKVAQDFSREPHVIVANLDATVASDVAQKYGIEGYPTIKFFPAGGDPEKPVHYNGGRTEQDFVDFLNEKAKTYRTVGGTLSAEAGRIASLDAIASDFIAAASDARTGLLTKAKKALEVITTNPVPDFSHKLASYYLKVMTKISTGKPNFATTELARLERIIKSGATDPAKVDSFVIRRNILRAFLGKKKADAAEKAVEDVEVEEAREEL